MQIRIKFLLALAIVSTIAFAMFTYSAEDSVTKKSKYHNRV